MASKSSPSDPGTFQDFVNEVRDLMERNAEKKGYNDTGVEGQNELYEFVQGMTGSDSHALGEIVYKVVRFTRKRDRSDLTKIAAWAYLIWRHGLTESSGQKGR